MRPNFFRLQALLVVADCGSIAAAARKLHITAPAVTKAIRQLERDYDAEFFLRGRSGVSPTPAGLAMIRRARLALAELDHAQDELREIRGLAGGKIAIGALAFARSLLLPRALVAFTAVRPLDDVAIYDGEFESLIEPLREGKLDFIVGALRETPLPFDVTQDRLFDDPVIVVARRDHTLARRSNVAAAELARFAWVVPPEDSPVRRLFVQYFADAKAPAPVHPVVTTSLEVMRGMILESDRLGIVSRNRVFYELRHGMLAELKVKLTRNKRPIGIIRRKEAALTPAAEEMVRRIKAVAQELRRAELKAAR
ncbi:MAG TPA: LysR family transcriptional regulator [Alphaproteobacteria bacterium]|nr:LysR family transcriptional regulator [Alphaproteobacteria bacterium]